MSEGSTNRRTFIYDRNTHRLDEHDPFNGTVIQQFGKFPSLEEAKDFLVKSQWLDVLEVGSVFFGRAKKKEVRKENFMPCPKCGEEMVGVEYRFPNKYVYDGISEWQCPKCHYRQGRWSGKELGPNEYEHPEERFAPDAKW